MEVALVGDPLAVGGALAPATTRPPWAGVNNALLYGVERIVCACSDLGFRVFEFDPQTKYTCSDLGFCAFELKPKLLPNCFHRRAFRCSDLGFPTRSPSSVKTIRGNCLRVVREADGDGSACPVFEFHHAESGETVDSSGDGRPRETEVVGQHLDRLHPASSRLDGFDDRAVAQLLWAAVGSARPLLAGRVAVGDGDDLGPVDPCELVALVAFDGAPVAGWERRLSVVVVSDSWRFVDEEVEHGAAAEDESTSDVGAWIACHARIFALGVSNCNAVSNRCRCVCGRFLDTSLALVCIVVSAQQQATHQEGKR